MPTDENEKIVCFHGLDNPRLCSTTAVTYDQVVAFVAVANEGAFTAASAVLHKSQPAISKLVRNLESELGVELFDRSRYRATLTDAGRLFLERAAALLEQTEALRGFGAELAGDVEPVVRLAIEAVTPLDPVLAALRAVRDRFPAVRIELATERLAGAAAALHDERADVVVATRIGLRGTRVEMAHFADVRIVPVVRAGHPLTRGAVAARALLRVHPQIVLRDSAQQPDAPSLNVLDGGLRWSVTDVTSKRDVILAGMGWGGLPEHVVARDLAAGRLVALSVPEFEAGTMPLLVMRRRDRAHGAVSRALWDELQRAGSSTSADSSPKPKPRPMTKRVATNRTRTRRTPARRAKR